MSLFRAIKSLCGGACHWVQETYCALGQRVGERLERASDAIAERRYLASSDSKNPNPSHLTPQPTVHMTEYRIINGHKHTN
jgi:hypothetical protein